VSEYEARCRRIRSFIWALISERIKLLIEAEIFTLLPEKEFFNTIYWKRSFPGQIQGGDNRPISLV